MDWFYRLFGNYSKVRFKVITSDGREGIAKLTFQSFNIDEEELIEEIKKELLVEKGVVAESIEILAIKDL